ncbi:hypothetical protein SGFS_092380 [Streptomyces graminofaciens]|uniref:Nicotinate-nucleotide--dimethylbenzimidazole phosphoribosyltransferase n=1 Tax=Streptomyces graminofaciens TaxID=68212 RepID=A0ABN5VWW6_9ACTN|nr:nicotinate-nucleotide--dimethylbenzimidazole phosphoribosyltransferase [Streptomyces graminofaciens]BBC37944.1 hypothetical protein SGFS_092380 [Streptomyces graminofaciens]
MTDTGQIPGEGLPESAGMVEQPGVSAPGAYAYLSETAAEDEDLLLPGAQSAWGNEVPPPAPEPVVQVVHEPVVHEPGPHETSGRDSGSLDLGAVRMTVATPVPQPPVARRPLHLGPLTPDASASPVRSLADRGPAGAPVPPAVRQSGPPTSGPEYLDVPPQSVSPWAAAPAPAPVASEATPAQAVPTEGAAAETVVPEPVPSLVAVAEAPVEAEVAVQVPEATVSPPEAVVAAPPVDEVAQAQAEAAQIQAEAQVEAAAETPQAEPVADVAQAPAPVEAVAEPQAPEAQQAADAAQTLDVVQTPEAAPTPEAAQAPEALPVPDGSPVEQSPVEQSPIEQSPVEPGLPETTPFPAAAEERRETPAQVLSEPQPPSPDVPQPPHEAADGVGDEPVEVVQVSAAEEAEPTPVAAVVVEDQQPAQEPVLTQDPQQAPEAPVAQEPPVHEPQPVEAVEAVEVPEFVEEVPPQPAADEAQAAEIPQPQAPVQGPQATDPAAHIVDVAAQTPDTADQAAQSDQSADTTDSSVSQPLAAEAVPASEEPQEIPVQEAVPAEQPVDVAVAEPIAPAVAEAPQPVLTEAAPQPPAPQGAVVQPPGEPEPVGAPLAAAAPLEAAQAPVDQPLGQFVPVEGSVPTTPHLAPTPPRGVPVPSVPTQEESAEESVPPAEATVPAPREAEAEAQPEPLAADAEPGLVQHADDLETRAADQEDGEAGAENEESTAAVDETPEEAQAETGEDAREEVRQSTGPAAPPYDDAEREAVLKVMRERRDIRNGFRGDPIPHDVLLRVLEAAHTAPSVGHSQPWDFVVIRSAETRRTMHELAQRQREAYAKSLPKGRAKQFKELKIEAILDTPVNIVVTADPTRGGRHTLGRHTQPQMAPYSSALAVENLWLAARAEGLGVGWVSFFDEREMVRALGLPEHLEVVAYLCVGYVDEFPDEPELMQAGWAKRRPLSWVVHEETYGRRALPGEDPHDLLAETVANIRPLDAKALGEAWERQKRMTKPAGALGMLEIISAQLSGLSRQCPPPIPEPAAVAIFAGDHGVHAQGVTPWPQEVTAQMVANFLGGGAVCNAFATQVGAEVCVVDVGVASDLPATPGLLPRKIRAGTSDMTTGPAMTREEAKKAIEVGIETARDLVAAGNKALLTGEMGIANTTASAALISVFTDSDPAEVTGRGTGINDETLARKTEVVRRAIDLHEPDPADPIGVLAAIGGFEHAAMVGLLLGGASLRTPVILDGVSAGAAALVARAIAPEVLAACIAGHRSAEPGHVAALQKLGLRPLVDLDLRLGEGTGALLALPVVQSAARAMHEVATFDSAGVTEK